MKWVNLFRTVKYLDPEAFREELNKPVEKVILDFSLKEHFNEVHIPGAKNIDLDDLKHTEALKEFSRWETFFIYSSDFRRTKEACQVLMEIGFINLFILNTGFSNWRGTLERAY